MKSRAGTITAVSHKQDAAGTDTEKRQRVSDAIEQGVLTATTPTEAESTREICKRTGIGRQRVMRLLHQYQDEGRLGIIRTTRPNIAGAPGPVVLYYLIEEPCAA